MPARIVQFVQSTLSVLPTLAVFGILAALGVVGHVTDWKIGKLTDLWRAGASADDPADREGEPVKDSAAPPSGVHFESAEAVQKSGIKTATVAKQPMSRSIVANGTIDYNRTRLAHLSTRAPGHVWKVYQRVGDTVRKGDVLGLIDAAEVGRAKAEFLQALRLLELKSKDLERQREIRSAVPERQIRETEAAVADARIRLFSAQQTLANLGLAVHADQVSGLSEEVRAQRLRFLGLPESVTRTLDPVTTTANLVPLVAPFDGVVIRSDMVEGEVVSSVQPQFTVADVSRLWVTLDVRQEDAGRVRKGQHVAFHLDGAREGEAAGTVSWISTEVDDKTRTVSVRAEVENADGQLRARSFGTGRILIALEPDAVTVPSESVQWDGPDSHVFVRHGDGLSFERRKVRVGIRNHDYTEIIDGVVPGEVVATTGSHVLKSESFKCCR